MPVYEFKCEVCDSITDEQFPMATRPSEIVCACGGKSHYRISAPNLMLKEAMLDGTKRPGWDRLREASRLNKEKSNARPEQKKQIEKEIRKLGVDIHKKGE